MKFPSTSHPQASPWRLPTLVACLAAATAMGIAATQIRTLSAVDPWYHNLDMDFINLVDALCINGGSPAGMFDQPGLPMKYLLAAEYHVLRSTGDLPVATLAELFADPDPLARYPHLVRIARNQSMVIALVLGFAGSLLCFAGTRRIWPCAIALTLLAGAGGIHYQALFHRPELLCALFGGVFAFHAAWAAKHSRSPIAHHFLMTIAGVCVGLAVLTKLPGIPYLPALVAFCGGIAWPRRDSPGTRSSLTEPAGRVVFDHATSRWSAFFALSAAGAGWWFLQRLYLNRSEIGALEAGRFQLLILVTIAMTTIATFFPRKWGASGYLAGRCNDVSLLLGGLLLSLLLSYGLLRAFMTDRTTTYYFTNVLSTVLNPSGTLETYASNRAFLSEATIFLRADLPLIVSALMLGLTAVSLRRTSWPTKVAIVVLIAVAGGMILMLSRRYFSIQYLVFVEVPLCVAIALSLHAIVESIAQKWGARATATVAVAASLLVCGGSLLSQSRVASEYFAYQAGAHLRKHQLEFMYLNGCLTGEYRRHMAAKYGDIKAFERALDTMLREPSKHY